MRLVCSSGGLTLRQAVVLCVLVWQLAGTQLSVSAPGHILILQPDPAPELRIDFNYNYTNALPPFKRELSIPGKEIARGLIPTVPPTPLLRNITDNELYLNTNHTTDFINGKPTTHRSIYNGHVFFRDLAVSSVRAGCEIPYLLDLFTYEAGCAGWFNVRSGWAGDLLIGDQKWRITVVDNLNGEIGQGDALHLQRLNPASTSRTIAISGAPKAVCINGHTFTLGFAFKPDEAGIIIEAELTETNPPLGKVSLSAERCRFVCLSNEWVTAVLDAAAGETAVPAGIYRVTGCVLEEIPGIFRQPEFIRCDRTVVIQAGQTASLSIGAPLRNTVQVTRERNILRLTYQLLGQAGEQYEYYNWKERPRFAVWKGPVKMGSGSLPFG